MFSTRSAPACVSTSAAIDVKIWANTIGDLIVSFLKAPSIYVDMYIMISSGRFPRGSVARLIVLRGFDVARESPSNSPKRFQRVLGVVE